MKRIVVSVTNDLVSDNRVHKVCTSLHIAGFNVVLIGRKLKKSLPVKRNYKTKRIRLFFNKGFLFYAEYSIRLFFILLFSKTDILLSNDLDTLLPNYLISKIKNKKIVYDSHEYFTQVPELINRKFIQKFWLKLEKKILPNLKHCYTVCESIANEYNKKYYTKFQVVRNVQYKNNIASNVCPLNITNKKIIIYQGALNIGRGIENVIKAMKYIDNVIFVIIGDGDISNNLKKISETENVSNKIIFTGKVPFEKLSSYTKLADLGISLEENAGLNYYYSLPNKIFDYINACVPVLCSDFPEMKNIVEKYKIGFCTNEKNPQKLSKIINNMLYNENEINKWKENLIIASNELCWENEENLLIGIFNNI